MLISAGFRTRSKLLPNTANKEGSSLGYWGEIEMILLC